MDYQKVAISRRLRRGVKRIGPLTLSALVVSLAGRPTPTVAIESGSNLAAQAPAAVSTVISDKDVHLPDPDRLKQEETTTRPAVPMLPDDIPDAINPDPTGIVGLYPEVGANLGMGHLRPENLPDFDNDPDPSQLQANWLRGVALPIYTAPNGDHWGWLINGWLIPNGYDPIAVGRDATFSMLETYENFYSFPVLSLREDGWFSFQYTAAGTAWTHVSQLDVGPTELTIEPWEELLPQANQVEFIKHGVSQPLRENPAADEPLVSLVSPSSIIEPLEVNGDWMRVRVTQPARSCQPLPGANSEEGWMRWRNDDQMPLVWFVPRDC